jgi:hypothetical protein
MPAKIKVFESRETFNGQTLRHNGTRTKLATSALHGVRASARKSRLFNFERHNGTF